MTEFESLHTTSQAFDTNLEKKRYNPASQQQLHQAMRLNPATLQGYNPVVTVQGSGISLQQPAMLNTAMYTSSTNPLRVGRVKHNQTVDLKPGIGPTSKKMHKSSRGETPEIERESNLDPAIATVNRLSPSYLNRTLNRAKKMRSSLVN